MDRLTPFLVKNYDTYQEKAPRQLPRPYQVSQASSGNGLYVRRLDFHFLPEGGRMEVVFITAGGRNFIVKVTGNDSLMRAAVDAGVPGIVAECGGSCSCGTCHVYVDHAWRSKLRAPGPSEASMLEAFGTSRPNSRLSCQIELNSELDGLTVEIPESQY